MKSFFCIPEAVNQRTGNTLAKRKKITKRQTMVDKVLHRKLMIAHEQHELQRKHGINSDTL